MTAPVSQVEALVRITEALERISEPLVIDLTAESDGSFTAVSLDSYGVTTIGTILAITTDPGTPAPTSGWSLTLVDEAGLDRLDAACLSRSSSTSQREPVVALVVPGEVLTLTITGNTEPSAEIQVTVWWTTAAMLGAGGLGTLDVSDADVLTSLTTLTSAVAVDVVEVDFSPTYDTSAFAPLDAMHSTMIELTGMAVENGGSGIITKLALIDADDQGAAGVMHIFKAATTQTANSAYAPSDGEAAEYIGSIDFGPWEDFNTSRASWRQTWLFYTCASDDTSLYAVLQTYGTPTHTANGMTGSVTAQRLS